MNVQLYINKKFKETFRTDEDSSYDEVARLAVDSAIRNYGLNRDHIQSIEVARIPKIAVNIEEYGIA